MAVKIAVVFVLVFLLLGGATFGWWRGWFGSSSLTDKKPPANQKVNSNRRAPAR
jgi:hypothetical protein